MISQKYIIRGPISVFNTMVHHAVSNPSEEVCGLIIGRYSTENTELTIAQIEEFKIVQNVAKQKLASVIWNPKETLKIMIEAHKNKQCIIGCFHSHPLWDSNPSNIDLNSAKENMFWLIYGGRSLDLRASYFIEQPKKFIQATIQSI